MQLTIHGPNLRKQDKGSFHVHTAECRDNKREVRNNGSHNPYTGDFDTVVSVAEFIYSDIIAEDSSSTADDYVSDFYFAPCVADLPYDKAEAEGMPNRLEQSIDAITALGYVARQEDEYVAVIMSVEQAEELTLLLTAHNELAQ